MKRRFQVFVSSTFTDLIEERQAAVGAILKAGHIPAGMELFTSGDISQMETIRKWIDESDVYMLILGGRYGSIEPTTGVSYTELEFDYAVQQTKPLFAVVISEQALEAKVKQGGSIFMEKENPKELVLFRKKVLSNTSSFFEDPKDIRLCVHESLSDFAANREMKGWVPANEVIDTRPLFDEINKLSTENRRLMELLAEQEKRASSQISRDSDHHDDLRKILLAIELKIPAKIASGKEEKRSLLEVFYTNKEFFINGVTNSYDASETDLFYFYNVCPKLQVHGLVVNERVASVRYRRYAITKEGSSFLAYLDRRVLLRKNGQGVVLPDEKQVRSRAKGSKPKTDSQAQSAAKEKKAGK